MLRLQKIEYTVSSPRPLGLNLDLPGVVGAFPRFPSDEPLRSHEGDETPPLFTTLAWW
jgi:hypothetical protein